MDEQLRSVLDECVNLVQATALLRTKVSEASSASGGRHLLDGSAVGLDGAALREVLDRVFGEHDPAVQHMGIPNWVHASDHVPCGLYKYLNSSPETSDKVEEQAAAAEILSELLAPCPLHTPRDPRSLYSLESMRMLVRRDVLPLATQRTLSAGASGGDCSQAVRMDPLLRILAERFSSRFKAPFLPALQRGFGRSGEEGGDAPGYSAAAVCAGHAFPCAASDAALLYTLNYLATPSPKWRSAPATAHGGSGSGDPGADAEARLSMEPLWCARMGLEPVRAFDPERDGLTVPPGTGLFPGRHGSGARGASRSSSSSSSAKGGSSSTSQRSVLPFLPEIIDGASYALHCGGGKRGASKGAASAEGAAPRATLYLKPPSLLTQRMLMDSLFWLGEAFGSAHPPFDASGGAGGGGGGSGVSEDPASPSSTHRLFLTAAIRYLLLNNPMYLVPLPGMRLDQQQQRAGGAFEHLAPPYASAAAPWDTAPLQTLPGGSSLQPPGSSALTSYAPPRADTLQALAVLLTQQTCDKTFHLVTMGGGAAQRAAADSAAVPVDGISHGTPLWVRAEEYVRRSINTPAQCSVEAWVLLERLKRRGGGGVGGVGMGASGMPRRGRDPIQEEFFPEGMYVMPETLCELHAPLFHFLRTHLERAPLGGEAGGSSALGDAPARNAVTFAAVVDLWLMVLTPWRGRPRYKNLLPVATPEGAEGKGAPGLRAFRAFDYTAAANDEVERAVRGIRQGQVDAWRAAGRGPAQDEAYDVEDDEAGTQVSLPARVLGERVRQGIEYRTLLGATLDFEPTTSAYGKARGACGEAIPTPPAHPEDPLGKRFPSGLPFAAFASWVPAHYAFYTHLLAIYLRRMGSAGLLPPAVALSNEALLRAGGGGPASRPLACPRNPALLEALEHVLDVFSQPELRVTLAEVAEDVEALFPSSGPQAPLAAAGAAAAAAAAAPLSPEDSARLSRRTLLLAHAHMLNLPPSLSPRAVFPPAFSRLDRTIPPTTLGSVRGAGGERGLRCCAAPGEALEHAQAVYRMLGAAGSTLASASAPAAPLPGITLPFGTSLLDWATGAEPHTRRGRVCSPFDALLRALPRLALSYVRVGLGFLLATLPRAPHLLLSLLLLLKAGVHAALRLLYGHGSLPQASALLSLSPAPLALAAVPPSVAAALPPPTRRLGPNASSGGGFPPPQPAPPSPLSSSSRSAAAAAREAAATMAAYEDALVRCTTSYTAFRHLADGSPAAILRYADRLALARDRAGLALGGHRLDTLEPPAHWQLAPIPPPWWRRLAGALWRAGQFILGMGSQGQYRSLRDNNRALAQQQQQQQQKGVGPRGAPAGAGCAGQVRRLHHGAATPLEDGIVANSWESSVVLGLLVALADALFGPQGWPDEEALPVESMLRCMADVRLLGALAALVAVARDSSLGVPWALGGALCALLLTRLLLLCWDGTMG